jgi:hypothetical protein
MNANAAVAIRSDDTDADLFAHLLRGYRFSLCQDAEAAARALDIRHRVYVEGNGYDIPVPDEYDAWSWFLLAEDLVTGEAVGSMRATPRWAGPFEAEEYFELPRELRSPLTVEVNRFAILPAYRKGKTFLPVVSVGLFKLLWKFLLERAGGHTVVICSKAERIWTYEWLRFTRTGLTAPYGKLGAAEHALLTLDVRRAHDLYAGHPFLGFFDLEHPEIVLPRTVPPVGLDVCPTLQPSFFKRSA